MADLRSWFRRHLNDPQVMTLVLIILALAAVVYFFGSMLAPVLAAVVIAYLLEGLVHRLERRQVPHLASVLLVFFGFLAFLVFSAFGVLPIAIRQLTQLAQQAPRLLEAARVELSHLPARFPAISEQQVNDALSGLGSELIGLGQTVLSYSLASVVTALTIAVYLILVPILVFFLLKDRDRILAWMAGFLPRDRPLANQVWAEVDAQIGNYARGKVWEILIVGSATFLMFRLLGLQYALLLAVLTGFSVLIPYIGALLVTFPVAVVAFLQWGVEPEFWWVILAYGIIQFIDGNLLVPLLFSEAVNLHPVAIIAAVLVFGGLWGFWGVFFAIPLATVIQAVLRAWPRQPELAVPPTETVATAEEGASPARGGDAS